MINSTFTGNSANGSADEVNGGAVAQNRMAGAHHYIHCTIVGNHTDGDGGALSIKAFVASTHALIADDGNFVQSTVLAHQHRRELQPDERRGDLQGPQPVR